MKMKNKLNHNKLAEGEQSGHSHQLSGGTLYDDGVAGTILIEPDADQMLVMHEEHDPVILPGTKKFRSGIKQEYDHFAEEARKVQD